MLPDLPTLRFVPLDQLLVHEWNDEQRTPPLIRRIQASGVFRHPPIVAPLKSDPQRYVVLDGANRTAALRAMQCPHILVQIVQPGLPGLRLRTWNHVLLDIEPAELIRSLHAIPSIHIVSSDQPDISLPLQREVGIALVQTPDGCVYGLSGPGTHVGEQIAFLNAVVNCYKRVARLDRTVFSEIKQVIALYSNLGGLVIFPKFEIDDLLELAGAGHLLPPGITRTTVAPRALYLNIPIEKLTSAETLEAKNAWLRRFIQNLGRGERIRYCPEEAFIFDE